MATQLLSGENCKFTDSACITLARLAVDIIGNDDFLSDAAQNSFVLDLVSAVGPTIAFDAIARQLWRINQYTPYGSGAYTYAYPPSLSGCPSTFLITHNIANSTSLLLSNEQQRTLAAFINARVSIADLLVVCPYHILMAFCKWLNAGNSNKVMSLDGSIQYNTSYTNGVYAYQNTYDAQDYLGNAIYYYQLTSLVQTSTGYIFDATYSASSIMSGLALDTIYADANTNELKYGLVATAILAVNPGNALRGSYANISNAYDISTTDGLTITRSANRNATLLTTTVLSAYATYVLNNSPTTRYNTGFSIISGKQLGSDNKQLITTSNLTAQGYFDAYSLQGVAGDIAILKSSGYTVAQISGIVNPTQLVPAFQIVSNYITAQFSYSEIIVGLNLSTPQLKYEKVVVPLSLQPDASAIAFLKADPFSVNASGVYGITTPNTTNRKFADATEYIKAGFSYSEVNTVFSVVTATHYHDTYRLNTLSSVVEKISALKNSTSNFSMANIRSVPDLSGSSPRSFKEAGYTFAQVKTEFPIQLTTASAFYTEFNGSSAFNAVTNNTPFYSVPQQIFIMKKMQYDISSVYSIVVSNNRVYNNIDTYSYKVLAGDTVLKTNVPAVNDEASFSTAEINGQFNLTNAQNIVDIYDLANERQSIYKIKNILPTVTISDIRAVRKNGQPLSAFNVASNYLGSLTPTGLTTPVDGFTFTAIKAGFSSEITTATAFYNAFNGSAGFNAVTNLTPFYSTQQQIFILKKMGFNISEVNNILNGNNVKVYIDAELYTYEVVAGDVALKANVPAADGDTSFSTTEINTYFNLTSAQNIFNVYNLANDRQAIFRIKHLLPSATISQIRLVRDSNGGVLSAFNVPANYSGSQSITVGSINAVVSGYTNNEITEGFFGDFNLLVGVTSSGSLPSFNYVDATYKSNGDSILTKLQALSQVKDNTNNYVYTAWRSLLINSINQTKSVNVTDLSGNDVANSVYRVMYISSVMNSDTTGTPFSPNTDKGLYAYFDLPTFITTYTAASTKPYDFLKPSEYLTYSTNADMTASSATATRKAKATTDVVTGQSYTAIPSGISFTTYTGTNTITVRYALGKIDANTYHLNSSSASVNNNSVRYFDSGYSIPAAIQNINSTNKVSVIATAGWPLAANSLFSLADVVSYIQSSFYDSSKTMDENITAAKALPYSANAWNFTNLINGPVSSPATLLNLDGISWKQLTSANANPNAITADLAANVNFIATTVTSSSEFVSMFNTPIANALTVANRLNSTVANGRTTVNGLWTIAGVAGSTNFSKTQRKGLFIDGTGNVSASLAAQILSSDDFISLKWSPAQLESLKQKLELSDLLTAKETITAEWGADYTASANSTYYRMIYNSVSDRIALVKLYYPNLSDTSAQAIAVLTNKADIIDAIAAL